MKTYLFPRYDPSMDIEMKELPEPIEKSADGYKEQEETLRRLRDVVARIAEEGFSSEGTYEVFSAWGDVDGWAVGIHVNCDKLRSVSKTS